MTARSSQRQQLHDLVDPVVAAAGYELMELSVTAAGRRSLVRVTVDAENGIDLDGVAIASRAISEALDGQAATGFAGPYVLEVSSPGVDRPLSEPRHYRRAVGRLVTVPVGGVDITGRVRAVAADVLQLEVDGVIREISWDQVGTGRMQVEFTHAAEPGDVGSDPAEFDADDDADDEADADDDDDADFDVTEFDMTEFDAEPVEPAGPAHDETDKEG